MPFAEQHLHRALECGEFVPYFQPLVDIRSGVIHGFEVLARWEHPTRGLLPSSAFIPRLERSRLINNLTAALLSQAFAAARDLPADVGLSVNLSPSQLHDRTLPDLIDLTAEEAEFNLRRLTLELTETALVDDLDLARSVAADFKRLGVRLALDDFGTGYSSLLHLQALPFDELKVDISFVRSMVQSRQSRKITAAVVSLGLSLGLTTVAEGIEEQNQANLLAWQGCNLGQGYLYGRPVPAVELPAVISRLCGTAGATTEVPALADPFLALDAQPTERLSQLRAIYDGAPVGLAFVNTELRYVNLNQQLALLNGKSVHEHLGRKVSEMVEPEMHAQFEPYLLRALKGESFPSVEVGMQRGDGSAGTTMISYQPVEDEAGEILGVCVSVTDISALKQKEEALRESEDHYRHTVELNPQIPWVADPCGNIISVSSRWEGLTGQTQGETQGCGWLEAVHPEDQELVRTVVQAALRSGEPLDMEYRVSDGRSPWVWMRSRGAPRRDSTGKIIRWYGSVECIDEHKRAQEELRCNEARLRGIFEAVPLGIVVADSCTGKVLSANSQAERLLGFRYTPGMIWSAEGWAAFDSNGRKLDGSNLPLMRAMRSRESTRAEEVLLCRPDGSQVWLSITAGPVCLDNGTQLGGVLVVGDIDERMWERDRLLELARELTLVASRTNDTGQMAVS